MGRTEDKDREAILARRRFFVASALAGVVATGCEKPPHPCLDVAPRSPDGEATATPTETTESAPSAAPAPCLEVMPVPSASATSAASEPDASPAPCLRVSTAQPAPTPTAPPMPCLKVATPKAK